MSYAERYTFAPVKRIVLTGPESSGKTTLACELAKAFDSDWIPEYARTYLEAGDGKYQLPDLEQIARVHLNQLLTAINTSDGDLIFLDTWMLELEIWARVRFDAVPEIITEISEQYPPDLYLLCKPDLPWEADPLRENPYDRDHLFTLYQRAVDESGIPAAIISGTGPVRLQQALDATRVFLSQG
jgi:nicotinamide riboside kinase